MTDYKYIVKDQHAFVQQLVCGLLCREYYFCFRGKIPDKKPPDCADKKLLENYNIPMSKHQRKRRKSKGIASVQFLRYDRDFVLIATKGEHLFFPENKGRYIDIRRQPLIIFDYSIAMYEGKLSVNICKERMSQLKDQFERLSTKRSATHLAIMINQLPFERYRGVTKQLASLFKLVNRKRKSAGLPKLKTRFLRDKRKLYRPFIDPHP